MIELFRKISSILMGLLIAQVSLGMATWKYPTSDSVNILDSDLDHSIYPEEIQSQIKDLGTADRDSFFKGLVKEFREKQKTRKFSISDKIAKQLLDKNPRSIASIAGGIIADHQNKKVWARFHEKYTPHTGDYKNVEALESLVSAGLATTIFSVTNLGRLSLLSLSFFQSITSVDYWQTIYKEHVSDPLIVSIAQNYYQVYQYFRSHSLHLAFPWLNQIYTGLYKSVTPDTFAVLANAALVTGAVTYLTFLWKEGRQVKDFDQLDLIELISVAVQPLDDLMDSTEDEELTDAKSFIGQSETIQTALRNSVDVCLSKLGEKFGNYERIYQLVSEGFCDPSLTFVDDLKEFSRKSRKFRRIINDNTGGRAAEFQIVKRVSPINVMQFLLPGFGYKNRLKNKLWFAKVKNVSPHVVVMDWMGDPTYFLRYLKQTFTVKTEEVFTSFQKSAQLTKRSQRRRFGFLPMRSQ